MNAMLPPIIGQIMDNFNLDVDPALSREENTEEVIKSAALLSGAIAVEPLPFADMLLITPLQVKMVLHIGKIYGFDITPERAKEIVAELGATVAYGMAARQVMRGVAKMIFPMIGGVLTAPMVYGWTFALGRMAQTYFERRVEGLHFGEKERLQVAKDAQKQSRGFLPSSQDFAGLAEELRKRAGQKDVRTLESETPKPAPTNAIDAGESELSDLAAELRRRAAENKS